MSRFFNPRLTSLEAYTPGEQPRDRTYIKLNTNESPYPPSRGVRRAMDRQALDDLRLYCDPNATVLKEKLAKLYDKEPSQIFVANGSDDILNFAFLAFGAEGVLFPDISYGFYEVFANLHSLPYEKIPLQQDFSIDVKPYCGQKRMVVIANPNAPTGIALPLRKIQQILEANPDNVVLIDEAYVDFGGESCAKLTEKYPNLLCVQTFSKSRSMAGARLGFAIGSPELIADLETIKYSTNPYNVNALTQKAGAAAVEDNGYYMRNCRKIIKSRLYTKKELEKLGFTVLPSKANFLFAKSDKIGGMELYLRLKEKGILVRHFEKNRICDYNRITIGSQKEMEAFIAAVEEILGA
ncbi:MAG: histidinol-phosphate transaminase [Ruminococcaceae bacterium]|nr:histidinol-phosphate transaminase [Oscillospiraceae bacterium]